MSQHLDVLDMFSVHPASPVLLTSKGPQKNPGHSTHSLQSAQVAPWRGRTRAGNKDCPKAESARMSTWGRLYGSCGGLFSGPRQQGADNTTLRRWQFEDWSRGRASRVNHSSLLVVGKLLLGVPSTDTFLPSGGRAWPQKGGANRTLQR